MKKMAILTVLLVMTAVSLGGCADKRATGALAGAAVGGTVGGLAGGTTGAVIGGVAGAGLGYTIAKHSN